MGDTSTALTRVESGSNLLADTRWRKAAEDAIAHVRAGMQRWQGTTLELGRLFYEVDAEKYYLVAGCRSFGDFLAQNGWNRRKVNGMYRAYEELSLKSGLPIGELAGVDVDLMLEARKSLTPARAPKILETARQVTDGSVAIAEFRRLWVDVSFTKEPPAPRRAAPAPAESASKVSQFVEGMLGWTSPQVAEALRLLADGLQRTSLLAPEEVAKIVSALEPAARTELIRELFRTTDFFDEAALRTIIRTGVKSLSPASLRTILGEIEDILAGAAIDVTPGRA